MDKNHKEKINSWLCAQIQRKQVATAKEKAEKMFEAGYRYEGFDYPLFDVNIRAASCRPELEVYDDKIQR